MAVLGVTDVAGSEQSPAKARQWVSDLIGNDHPAFDAVELLASELVTNSVKHSESDSIKIFVADLDDHVFVFVCDKGGTYKRPTFGQAMDEASEGGRGLRLVSALSRRCGWRGGEDGVCVWAEVTPDDA